MRFKTNLARPGVVLIAVFCLNLDSPVCAQREGKAWDQERALEMVRKVLDIEQNGPVWDRNIKWSTDAKAVVRRSQKERKPIFVYWYVKKADPGKTVEIEKAGSC